MPFPEGLAGPSPGPCLPQAPFSCGVHLSELSQAPLPVSGVMQ